MKIVLILFTYALAANLPDNQSFLESETELESAPPVYSDFKEKPVAIVHKILQVIFGAKSPNVIRDYDICLARKDPEIMPVNLNEVTSPRDLYDLCNQNNKQLLTHRLLADVLIGLQHFLVGCDLMDKEADVIVEKIEELAGVYDTFLKGNHGKIERFNSMVFDDFDLAHEIPPELIKTFNEKNPGVLMTIPQLKKNMAMLRSFVDRSADTIKVDGKKMSKKQFVKTLDKQLGENWEEMVQAIAEHIDTLCMSQSKFAMVAQTFMNSFNGFLSSVNGIFGNDDFFLH